jgi:hypothetical protein
MCARKLYLLVEDDLPIEVFHGELPEVFDFLRVIGLHFRHGCVQNGLAVLPPHTEKD